MPSRKDHREKGGKANPKTKYQRRKSSRLGFRKDHVIAFLFEFAFQAMALVGIAAALTVGSIYAGKDGFASRGVMWSVIFLVIFILLMLGILADRHLFNHGATSKVARHKTEDSSQMPTKARPFVFVGNTALDPIVPGKNAVFNYAIKNSGTVEANGEVRGWTFCVRPSGTITLPTYHPKGPGRTFKLAPTEFLNGHFRTDFTFTDENLAALNKGDIRLFVYAIVEYRGEDSPRKYTLPLCFVYDPNAGGKMSLCSDDITINGDSQPTPGLTLDQRPWISVLTIEGVPEGGKPFELGVVYKNVGKTLASDVRVFPVVLGVPKGERLPDFESEANQAIANPAAAWRSAGILPPDTTYVSKHFWTPPFSQQTMDKIKSGEVVIYVFGKVNYLDISDCPHWTKFCFRMNPVGRYAANDTYNEVDKNHCP